LCALFKQNEQPISWQKFKEPKSCRQVIAIVKSGKIDAQKNSNYLSLHANLTEL
jgi:hypothetical protein